MNVEENQLYREYFEHDSEVPIHISGSYNRVCVPKCIWFEGNTYFTAYDQNDVRNAILIRTGLTPAKSIQVSVNTKTDLPLDHQHPVLIRVGRKLYVFQTNGHNEEIKITEVDIDNFEAGGVLHHVINGEYGYVSVKLLPDGRIRILTRINDAPTLQFDQVILISDPNDYKTWTERVITDADYGSTKYRHYPSAITTYGHCTKDYIGLAVRNDNSGGDTEVYFAQTVYTIDVNSDYSSVSNVSGTFSKNVVSDSRVTNSELENHFTSVGFKSNIDYCGTAYRIAINDVLYGSFHDSATIGNPGVWKFYKEDKNGITEYALPSGIFENLPTTPSFGNPFNMWYNGKNLCIRNTNKVDSGFFYTCDLEFSNWRKEFQYFDLRDSGDRPLNAGRAIPPENLDEVEGIFAIGGAGFPGETEGKFPYFLTDDKMIRL